MAVNGTYTSVRLISRSMSYRRYLRMAMPAAIGKARIERAKSTSRASGVKAVGTKASARLTANCTIPRAVSTSNRPGS